MSKVSSYLKFLLDSYHLHGIHSPFVYQLEQQCLKDPQNYSDYKTLTKYRSALLKDKQTITMTDLGAGSRVNSSNIRRVDQIVRQSASTMKRSKMLYRLTNYLNSRQVLELGTNLGIGTQALALNPNTQVTSVEGCPSLYNYADQKLQPYTNIKLINGSFNKVLPDLQNQSWDLIFMDGHHDNEATLNYFNQLLPATHEDTLIIIDDINWSKGMQEAWNQIKAHPKVTVTVDTFFWGLVFFRKGQAKEHFSIRL
ncbi:O-methyltransferase [Winogradskyella aurantiaca]|uniref:O-methyltransferase n=1 Tax=Winogradskyella aurantiaca TaxID=2219558 RepID=UPI000E1C7522|nr:class I SAM-dependent methyltransferase [Winogradskyella aurantiaca]